jgi:hypothetical protein
MTAAALALPALLLAGCKGVVQPGEREARGGLNAVGQAYWPAPPSLPPDADGGLSNYL